MGQAQVGAPTELPTALWGLEVPLGFFLTGGTIASGKTFLQGVMPAWGRAMKSVCSPFSYLLMKSVLVSVVQGVLQPHPHIL